MKINSNNLALVLGGGAARGAFHLGVLAFIEDSNIDIKAYSGSSIGAIIAASHASGISAREQLKIFSSKDMKEIFKFNYFKNGLLKIDPYHKIIKELLPIKNIEEIPKTVWVNAYDLKKRELLYFSKGDTISLCMASSALSPIFKPISYENMYLIDGGLFDNLPIKPLLNKNYEICTVDLFTKPKVNHLKTKTSIVKKIKKRVLNQLYINHKFTLENTDYYLGSERIRDFSLFTFQELQECFNLGFKEAQKHF